MKKPNKNSSKVGRIIKFIGHILFPKKNQIDEVYKRPQNKPMLSNKNWSGQDYIHPQRNSCKLRIRTRGKKYNLQKLFNRLNNEHFGGAIKGKITWSKYGCKNVKRKTSIAFGTYSPSELLIRIHPALDTDEVPEFFIEHIIHHEMLHQVYPPIQGNGSNLKVHHYQFRVAEAATPTYEAAIAWRVNHLNLFYR
jgi:hypothetical protein